MNDSFWNLDKFGLCTHKDHFQKINVFAEKIFAFVYKDLRKI